jgi:hypothetical protein
VELFAHASRPWLGLFLLMLAGLGVAVFAHASRPWCSNWAWWSCFAHASRAWCSFLLMLAGLGVTLLLMLAGLGGAVFAHASLP